MILGRAGPWEIFPKVRLRAQQRTTHMYVLNITGQGKSKLLEHCLFQDVMNHRGCGLIDPHTDLARDLLAYLAETGFFKDPQQEQHVIYFDNLHNTSSHRLEQGRSSAVNGHSIFVHISSQIKYS